MNEQVVVIRHEAISTDAYVPQFTGFFEEIDEPIVVFIFGESYFAPATSIHDMIPGAGIFYAQWPAHKNLLAS
jgi:hypothetical protein